MGEPYRDFVGEALASFAGSIRKQGAESVEQPWPTMEREAFHGLAGDVVGMIEPHTEADSNGILLQFLTMFGNAVGDAPYYQIEGDKHHSKLFVVASGATAKGRKGTSLGRVRQLMKIADSEWETANVRSGLSSGEGVIFHVRDAVSKLNKDGIPEEVDSGVIDKRMLLLTEEFVSALSVMERAGNTLSPVLRDAWGTATLQTLTRNSPLKATGSHISIIGHVTDDELRSALTRTEMANGFANRFLFLKVKRSKVLPHGGSLDEQALYEMGARVGRALSEAKRIGRVRMSSEASSAWISVYGELSGERPGLLGAITGRAEAQVIRLALVYAILDNSEIIQLDHLKAALAVWDYCDESAAQIFGDLLGDHVADTIRQALCRADSDGLSRTAISQLFQRNVPAIRIQQALELLVHQGLVEVRTTRGNGRPAESWHAMGGVH
jgi:hypothetical protein